MLGLSSSRGLAALAPLHPIFADMEQAARLTGASPSPGDLILHAPTRHPVMPTKHSSALCRRRASDGRRKGHQRRT